MTISHPEIDAKPRHPRHKKRCIGSLEEFGLYYFADLATKELSPAHRSMIGRIEAAIDGDCLAVAMPRGSGKSTWARIGAIFAALTGRSKYLVILTATEKSSKACLKSLQSMLRFNDRLAEDFPQMIVPIRAGNGIPRGYEGQTYRGELTGTVWLSDRIVFPRIPGDPGSECVIDVASITGEVRGRNHTRLDGSNVRPDFVLADDPQSRGSAKSTSETEDRLAILKGDVLYMAGPGEPIGCVVTCTVIRPDDLACQLLDRDRNPEFHGIRVAFFESWPDDGAMSLWTGEYDRLRRKALIDDEEPIAARDFYAANREAMDRGCSVYWTARHKPDELSAIEHGMRLYLRDRAAFMAEFQNQPEAASATLPVPMLSESQIQAKTSGLPEFTCPKNTGHVVAFIDCHPEILYGVTLAVQSDMTASVISYSTWPPQPTRDFSHTKPNKSLSAVYGGSVESNLTQALIDYADKLCGRDYPVLMTEQKLAISKVGIDTGYLPESVAAAIQRSEHATKLIGTRGVGLGPEMKQFADYDLSPSRVRQWGPRHSCRWYVPAVGVSQGILRYDKYHHLSLVHGRWTTPVPEASYLDVYGDRYTDHKLFAGHMQGQKPEEVHAKGRSVIKWLEDRRYPDHWLDGVIGCYVLASYLGCDLPGRPVIETKQEFMRLSDLYGKQKR